MKWFNIGLDAFNNSDYIDRLFADEASPYFVDESQSNIDMDDLSLVLDKFKKTTSDCCSVYEAISFSYETLGTSVFGNLIRIARLVYMSKSDVIC